MSPHPVGFLRRASIALAAITLFVTAPLHAATAPSSKVQFKIPAGDARPMLRQFAAQAKREIIFAVDGVDGVTTNAVDGELTYGEALSRMLLDTGLIASTDAKTGAIAIRKETDAEKNALRAVPTSDRPESNGETQYAEKKVELPVFEVMAGKVLNMDIPRSRDDALPFVVFDRQRIEQSGAASLEDFLKQRLPMNTQQSSFAQSGTNQYGNRSQIDLRGLGSAQTLILIDGRRAANSVLQTTVAQQDLNGIPLSAVERIEVLPTTASGIYGGDATGGVINIILRRDYTGSEFTLGYENTFHADDNRKRISLAVGATTKSGRTNLLLTASYVDSAALLRKDRPFLEEYRTAAYGSNPAIWMPPVPAPLGATSNIRSQAGNLVLDDGRPLNSSFTFVPYGYSGYASDSGAAFVANAGRYNFDPALTAQPGGGLFALTNNPSIETLGFTLRHQHTPSFQSFIEAAASNNVGHFLSNGIATSYLLPAAAPNNPFQQPIQVTVPIAVGDSGFTVRTTDRRFVGGLIFKLPRNWQAEAEFSLNRTASESVEKGRTRPDATAGINASIQADPEWNLLKDTGSHALQFSPFLTESRIGPFETETRNLVVQASGPVVQLSSGSAVLNLRLESRDEDYAGGTSSIAEIVQAIYPERSISADSAYMEFEIPMVRSKRGIRSLDISVSARYDRFSINGATGFVAGSAAGTIQRFRNDLSSTNPTLAVRWTPRDSTMVRASVGTGFLPPNVTQLAPSVSLAALPASVVDPRRGGTPIGVSVPNAVRTAGNPELSPERSKSWSAGVVFAPEYFPGFRVSMDYIRIDKDDNIRNHPQGIQGLINDELLFPDRIVRASRLPTDPAGWAGPITFVDFTLMNVARANIEAIDFQLDYSTTVGSGTLEIFSLATFNRRNEAQTKAGEPTVNGVGFTSGVLRWKANAGAEWSRGPMGVGVNATYYDSYRVYRASSTAAEILANVITQGSAKVDDQVYFDAFMTWRAARESTSSRRLLHSLPVPNRWQFTIGVRNILNREPPRDLQTYSTYGDPRLSSYYVTLKSEF